MLQFGPIASRRDRDVGVAEHLGEARPGDPALDGEFHHRGCLHLLTLRGAGDGGRKRFHGKRLGRADNGRILPQHRPCRLPRRPTPGRDQQLMPPSLRRKRADFSSLLSEARNQFVPEYIKALPRASRTSAAFVRPSGFLPDILQHLSLISAHFPADRQRVAVRHA